MLFLFNDVIFELGDLNETLSDGQIPLSATQFNALTEGQLTDVIRDALFHDPNLPHTKTEKTQHLCALLAFKLPSVNAVLALPNEGAQGPEDVGIRFANVAITTLAYLWGMQCNGELTTHHINSEVWTRIT